MNRDEIVNLTDEELFAKLIENGLLSGPIADSTRPLYQLMLLEKFNGKSEFNETIEPVDETMELVEASPLIMESTSSEPASLHKAKESPELVPEAESVRRSPRKKMAAQTTPEPVNKSESSPVNKNESTPIKKSESSPVNKREYSSVNKSESSPENEGESTPENEGESTPENEGESTRRRHTFARWVPEDDEDDEDEEGEEEESGENNSGQEDVYPLPNYPNAYQTTPHRPQFDDSGELMKREDSSMFGACSVYLIIIAVISILAALFLVGTESDPYESVEHEARQLAKKLAEERKHQ